MIGIFIFAELFDVLEPLFVGSNLGNITLVDSFDISPYWIIFVFTIIGIVSFVFSDIVRKKVKKVFY